MDAHSQWTGLDAARLERITDHLERNYIGPQKIAGCQVSVARHGHIAYQKSFGSMDLERGKAMRDDTIFRIYSMTKPITSVALMTLYEQGYFQLNDPVSRYVPSWKNHRVWTSGEGDVINTEPAHRPVSFRDVLSHTAGLTYGGGLPGVGIQHPIDKVYRELKVRSVGGRDTMQEFMDKLGQVPLRFQPGTHWLYSHGMDVAARLVEIMSGQRFDEYLRASIFDPLGMVDTGFFVPEAKVDRFAACYGRNARKELVLVDAPATSTYLRPPRLLNGGGGLVGSTADYVRFCTMLANGGELDGERVLSRKTLELMTCNHLAGDAEMSDLALPMGYGEVGFAGNGFGLTVAVSRGPGASGVVGSPGEFMWGGAASTAFWVDPVERLAVVFMTQLLPSGTFNFRGQLKTLVYGALI